MTVFCIYDVITATRSYLWTDSKNYELELQLMVFAFSKWDKNKVLLKFWSLSMIWTSIWAEALYQITTINIFLNLHIKCLFLSLNKL